MNITILQVAVLLLLFVTVKEVLLSIVSTDFWSPTFLKQDRERRLCVLGGKSICPILSLITERLQAHDNLERTFWNWLKNVWDGLIGVQLSQFGIKEERQMKRRTPSQEQHEGGDCFY